MMTMQSFGWGLRSENGTWMDLLSNFIHEFCMQLLFTKYKRFGNGTCITVFNKERGNQGLQVNGFIKRNIPKGEMCLSRNLRSL